MKPECIESLDHVLHLAFFRALFVCHGTRVRRSSHLRPAGNTPRVVDGHDRARRDPSRKREESMNNSFDMSLLQKQHQERGEDEENEVRPTLTSSWEERELIAASKKRSCRVSHDSLSATEHPLPSFSKAKLPATPASVARRRHLYPSSPPLPPLSSSIHPSLTGRRKSKHSFGTCTTATSTIHGSDDHSMHSVDSSSTQGGGDALTTKNFRFTSFPASLPRIHAPPKTTSAKTSTSIAPVSTNKFLAKPHVGYHSSNNNDSHNTSLSSWNHTADYIGYSDDEDQDVSPLQSASFYQLSTPRARLNFNDATMFQSDGGDHQLPLDHLLIEQVLDQTNKGPFKTSNRRVSAQIDSSSEWGNEDYHCVATYASSVAVAGVTYSLDNPKGESGQDVHFQLPCSPVLDIPEEETCTGDSGSSSHSYSSRKIRCHKYVATSASAATTPLTHSSSVGAGHGIRSSTSSRRPMPDMHAFEDGEAGTAIHGLSSSSISSSTTHTSNDVLSTTVPPLSPKLLCPPTPVRVHPMFRDATEDGPVMTALNHTKLARSNSLITNKVLAKCSPQLLLSLRSSSSPEERSTATEGLLTLDFVTSRVHSTSTRHNVLVEPSPLVELHGRQAESSSEPTMLSSIPFLEPTEAAAEPAPTVVSLARNFEVLSALGSGAFADVYKVASRRDGRMYAIKRNRRQFRSKRDRETALSEVRSMQRIQSQMNPLAAHGTPSDNAASAKYGIYLLFFYQAWQEDGHILCQTELCCRDTCREMIDTIQSWNTVTSLKFPTIASSSTWFPPPATASSSVEGRLVPESVIWKICHDISAGLAFIHSHKVSLVHNDIKPSNILFVQHPRYGALCKIGDFGMARVVGTSEDGQEGDQKYMTLEVLQSGTLYPSADIFSLGLTLYEMASYAHVTIPSDGPRWHELRSGVIKALDYPVHRSFELIQLIRSMIDPNCNARPSAGAILTMSTVVDAGTSYHQFLRDYIYDVELREQQEEQWANRLNDEQTPQNAMSRPILCSPPLHQIPQLPFGVLRSPKEAALASS
jgi:serine/threonine protein kinase